MLEAILGFLLPPRCGGCGVIGPLFCDRCAARTRRLREPLCSRCGSEIEFARAYCRCRRRLRALRRLRSAVAYEGPVERALQEFKYGGRRPLARPLARLLAERVAIDGLAGEVLMPVPLHPLRLRERGYNQSELLARELGACSRLPVAAGLERTRATSPQVGLDRRRRLANVAGAFSWNGPPLRGEVILLVDDVATTGATLEACAAALMEAGAARVMGLTVARVAL